MRGHSRQNSTSSVVSATSMEMGTITRRIYSGNSTADQHSRPAQYVVPTCQEDSPLSLQAIQVSGETNIHEAAVKRKVEKGETAKE
jgi:hypothetical protein